MIDLLIVTGVRFYRDGLAAVLATRSGIGRCDTARDAREARAHLAAGRPPDVMLLDVGLDGAREMVAEAACAPGVRVVAVAVGAAGPDLLDWMEAGVSAYVGRDASIDELGDAVEAAGRGELRCSPDVSAILLRNLACLAGAIRDAPTASVRTPLTPREHEIVALIARGLSNKAIARHLGIRPATAKNHVHNILRKLQVEHRREAADWLRVHEAEGGSAHPPMDRSLTPA